MNNFRRLFALNRKLPWQCVYQSQMLQARHLFTPSSLGLDLFASVTDQVRESFTDKEDFKRKMKVFCDPTCSYLVLLEDVKKMTAITETDEDLNILHALLLKYFKEQGSVTYSSYKVAPVVMRALHILNKPNKAIEMVEDPVCNPHFNVFSAVLVFLDLLLTNNMYNEVLKFYNIFESSFQTFPNHLTLLLLAACYKLNTKEGFSKAKTVYRLDSEYKAAYRKTLFIAAIAINQNDAFCALEVLHYIRNLDSIPANLKLIAFVKGGRYADALGLGEQLLQKKIGNTFFIPEDMLSNLEKEIRNAPEEFKNSLNELLKKLEACVINEPLDKFLFAKVQLTRSNKDDKKQLPRRRFENSRF